MQKTAALVTFTEQILDGKLPFLRCYASEYSQIFHLRYLKIIMAN